MEEKRNQTEYNCNGMNITRFSDFTRGRSFLPAHFENGTEINVRVNEVRILNLADNHLETWQLRRLLSIFPNLQKLNVDRNQLQALPRALLRYNPQLRFLSAAKNFPLRIVSRRLLYDESANGTLVLRPMNLLNLSENNYLSPSCLNTIFTDSEDFLACFRVRN